ncbi:MAG: hypothetical protein ABI625_12725 [bacterium]
MHSSRGLNALFAIGAVAVVTASIGACNSEGLTAPDDVRTPANATANAMITGAYDVRASSAQHTGGALMFDVGRALIDSVTSTTGAVFFIDGGSANASDVTARVVYTGQLGDGVIATLWTHGGDDPLVTVQQAADEGTLAKRTPGEFRLTATARPH